MIFRYFRLESDESMMKRGMYLHGKMALVNGEKGQILGKQGKMLRCGEIGECLVWIYRVRVATVWRQGDRSGRLVK